MTNHPARLGLPEEGRTPACLGERRSTPRFTILTDPSRTGAFTGLHGTPVIWYHRDDVHAMLVTEGAGNPTLIRKGYVFWEYTLADGIPHQGVETVG